MAQKSRIDVIYKDLAKEHKRILELLDLLGRRARGEEGPELLRLVEELRQLLIVHFAREQLPDGFYDAMHEELVGHERELDALIDEHRSILSSVNAILERLKGGEPATDTAISSELVGLIHNISQHEHKEHELASTLVEK